MFFRGTFHDIDDLHVIGREERQNDAAQQVQRHIMGKDACQHADTHTDRIDDQEQSPSETVRQRLVEWRDQIDQITAGRNKTQSA